MSEKRTCGFCHRGKEANSICGRLLVAYRKKAQKFVVAHKKCMQYSSKLTQYQMKKFGGFEVPEVDKEIKRGVPLKCFICKLEKDVNCRGATCGCTVKKCKQTFHFYCAAKDTKAAVCRYESPSDDGHPVVHYSTFCSEAHRREHEALWAKEHNRNLQESEETDQSEDEDDSSASETTESDVVEPPTKKFKENAAALDASNSNRHNGNNHARPSLSGYVVCLLDQPSLHPNLKEVLDPLVQEKYRLPSERVHVWKNDKFSFLLPHQMPAYFLHISECIRDKNLEELERLLFRLNEEDVAQYNNYVSPSNTTEQHIKSVYVDIQKNFIVAKNEVYHLNVGQLLKLKQWNTNVILICLDDALDPTESLRQSLVRHRSLYHWGKSSELKAMLTNPSAAKPHVQQEEVETLKLFLSFFVKDLGVCRYPRDAFMCSNSPSSVTQQLYEHFAHIPSTQNSGVLAFLGPVEPKLLDHKAFVAHAMKFLIDKHLQMSGRKVVCVFDVGISYGMVRTIDMVCDLPKHVKVRISSGLNPTIDPVYCLVVELTHKPQ